VLQQVRPWIEPAPAFEKNPLGLSDVFCNRLRFTWVMALLADAVVVLRARALLGRPVTRPLLTHLLSMHLALELGVEAAPPLLYTGKTQILKIPNKLHLSHFGFRNTLYKALRFKKGNSIGSTPYLGTSRVRSALRPTTPSSTNCQSCRNGLTGTGKTYNPVKTLA
jgi:hypothetical protein